MDIQELILKNSDKVRRDSSLMAFYIESYEKVFGYKPNCAGCTFSTDWNNFVRKVTGKEKQIIQNYNKMDADKNFKLKKVQNKIFAYRIEKQTRRLYDNNFTNEFVDAFLTHGTKEEIAERKKLFSVLPEKFMPKVKGEPVKVETETDAETKQPIPEVKKTRKKRTPKNK